MKLMSQLANMCQCFHRSALLYTKWNESHTFRHDSSESPARRQRISSNASSPPSSPSLKTKSDEREEKEEEEDVRTGAAKLRAEITYCYYPFLRISNLHSLISKEATHLEAKGCFRVPIRPILDHFVRGYFLHVHPMMPILEEEEFWDMYEHQQGTEKSNQIPLILLQSMIFASCSVSRPKDPMCCSKWG